MNKEHSPEWDGQIKDTGSLCGATGDPAPSVSSGYLLCMRACL